MIKNKLKSLRYLELATVLTILSVVSLLVFVSSSRKPQAIHQSIGVNEQINYQGRLLTSTGAVVPDGTYNVEFKIYQDGDGVLGGGDEALKWTETRTGGNRVTVKNGYFSVYLGSITAFGSNIDWNQDVVWLSINIGGTGSPSWDGEMSPFTRFSSTPYALNAKALNGITSTGFVQLAQGAQTDASASQSSIAINKTGNTADILDLMRAGSSVLKIANDGSALFQNSTNSTAAFQIQNSAGTSNLFIADTTNTRIGIGATPANSLLTIGTNTTTADGGITFGTDTNLYRGGSNLLRTDDNVLVRTSSNSLNAFRIQDSGGNDVMSVSTLNNNKKLTVGGNVDGSLGVYGASGNGFEVFTSSGGSLSVGLDVYEFFDSSYANLLFSADGTTGNFGIGLSAGSANYKLDVDGDINISPGSVYRIDGVAGSTATCSGGQFLKNQVVLGGLTMNGTCSAITGAEITDGSIANADLANSSISLALGTSGTDINWGAGSVSLGGTATLNLPDASATARGLVTTGDQTFNGYKTFNQGARFDNTGVLVRNLAADAFKVQTTFNVDLLSVDTSGNAVTLGSSLTDGLLINSEIRGGSPLSFEGATNDDVRTTFSFVDPTANRTITFPNTSGAIVLDTQFNGDATVSSSGLVTIQNGVVTNAKLANSSINLALGTSGTNANWSAGSVSLGGTATLNLPDASASNRGLVTTGAQTFAGLKTFGAGLTANSGAVNLNATGTSLTNIGNTTGALTLVGSSGSTISFGGLTIDSAELNLLDGKNAALVDVNDAVLTAITGTGALNAGSITSGFGAIDVGASSITTTGTIGTAGLTTFTGGGATFADTVNLPGGGYISLFNCCGDATWINLPTTGPSGIGTGGAGANPFLAYVSGPGNWFTNAVAGDTAYRNTSGRLLFGASATAYQMAIATGGITFDTPTTFNGSLTANSTVALGNGSSNFSVNSSAFKVTTAGAVSGVTTLDTSGNITTGGTFVGNGRSGITLAACANDQYIGNGVRIDDGLITQGSCRTDATSIFSDLRLKENIDDVGSVLDKIRDINIVTFDYKCNDPNLVDLHLSCDKQRGVIAQELEQLFPDLVREDSNGYKMVDAIGLGFYNLKAVSELAHFLNSSGEASFSTASVTNGLKTDSISALTANGAIHIGGDVIIDGNIIAKKIKADQIEGLDILAGQVRALSDAQGQSTAPPDPTQSTPEEEQSPNDTTVLKLAAQQASINLDLSVGGGLTVGGPAEFKGNSIFYKLVTFVEKAIFKNDVTFEGTVAFNSDTGGFAVVRAGQDRVRVTFDRPYAHIPVVTVTVKNGQFVQYAYTDLSPQGFTIILQQPAVGDVEFSWTALSVPEAKTAQAN